MLTAKRRHEPSVVQRLLDEPYRFEFFQAVRMLELWLKRNDVPHDSAVADYLRFKNSISLSFPASELDALSIDPKSIDRTDQALLAALQKDTLNHIDLTPTFMGFLGSSGVLPAHYTERIATHVIYEKDEGPRAFLDSFSNRALALFYEAWRKYRLEFKYEIGKGDRFLPLLLSFSGLSHRSLHDRLSEDGQGVLDESLGYYATALSHRPASAAYIQRVLSEYFGVPIAIEQFIGHWYEVPLEQQTKLGQINTTLGSEALIGARVWQRDLRLLLAIGPLDKKNFDAFLPGGIAAKSLEKMLSMFTGLCLEYEVQLIFHSHEVQGTTLLSGSQGGRLGWDTFLAPETGLTDRAEVRYEIHAL